jgi:E3 ubiquitin-protein ligase FANCL
VMRTILQLTLDFPVAAKFVSLQIDINPSSPQGLPECKFFGADTMIAPLRQLLNNNLNRWNETKTICQNLEHILQIQFPSPASREAQGEELRVQCQICYAYRHPEIGDTPDRVCDNPRCGNSFHSHPCLLEWLQSSSTKRVSFDSVSGECPYCMFPITVKLMRRSK